MLWIFGTLAIGAAIIPWILRRPKSSALDHLGTMSARWIAEERSASHDGLR
jgi:hypothetical protein